jgi:hypothetical protein
MHRSPTPVVLALLTAACAHAGAPRAEARAEAAKPGPAGVRLAADLGERGVVVFLVPDGWKATSGEPVPGAAATLRFEPPAGHHLLVVTPLWGPGDSNEPLGPEVARVLVEAARDRAREGAVEGELPIRPLEPPGLAGWYFASTDRELQESGRPPDPDEYRCAVQGAVVAGPLVLAFNLLDDGDGPQRREALSLLQGATHHPAAPAQAEVPREPSVRTHSDPSTWAVQGPEPLELALPGKSWALLLDLPAWSVAETMRRPDGGGLSVIARHPPDHLILSASVVDSAGRRSAESCRDADWARIAGIAGVGEARLEASAGEARAFYTVGEGDSPTRHLSAWRYRDGACLHLHLSLPGTGPAVDAALLEALKVARYGEAL